MPVASSRISCAALALLVALQARCGGTVQYPVEFQKPDAHIAGTADPKKCLEQIFSLAELTNEGFAPYPGSINGRFANDLLIKRPSVPSRDVYIYELQTGHPNIYGKRTIRKVICFYVRQGAKLEFKQVCGGMQLSDREHRLGNCDLGWIER